MKLELFNIHFTVSYQLHFLLQHKYHHYATISFWQTPSVPLQGFILRWQLLAQVHGIIAEHPR